MPGVPPICELARQLDGTSLAESALNFESDGPAPSGDTGQASSTL
jgi:hypothetical protein